MTQTCVEMATVFVVAQIRARPCSLAIIEQILHTTHATLLALSRREVAQRRQGQQDAQLPETLASLRQRPWRSLQRAQVICLECGTGYRLLSNRHLALHGLTAKAYKKKYGLPLRQSLSARALTQRRRRQARERGAGQHLAAWRTQRRQQTA
jgi:predicted transcriptional regulator